MTRIAIVSGICVNHDAISNAIVGQATTLRDMPGVRSVDVIAQYIDRELPCRAHQVASSWQLLQHPAFVGADVAIFHWGIHYDLFDAVVLSGFDGPRIAVHFHNCTPEEYVPEPARPTARRSLRQAQLMASTPVAVWTYSEFNRRTLRAWGVPEHRIQFVPFPIEPPRPLVDRRAADRFEIASVGRLVPAKAQHVLIEALALLPPNAARRCTVRFAGNADFSEPTYGQHLIELARQVGVRDRVQFVGQPDDDNLWRLYESSHAVVSTSLHEGLCVPIIEGYLAGCRAIGTTAGNLPFVVVPPDPVVPPLDPTALAAALERMIGQGASGPPSESIHELVSRHSRERTRQALREALTASITPVPAAG